MLIDNRRGTGRTTRMVKQALADVRAGYRTYVVMHNDDAVNWAKSYFREAERQGVQFETVRTMGGFDHITCTFLRAHEACRIHIDHHTIFTLYGNALEHFHRWDSELYRDVYVPVKEKYHV